MADVTAWAAFAAGVLPFLSPCILVPASLAFVAARGPHGPAAARRARRFLPTMAFVLGFGPRPGRRVRNA